MTFIIGLLTFVLVLICIALILLVLIQLPKKEAGIGVAFGGGATDALFGAGSGTVLTKATKYAATGFFILAIIVGMMQSRLTAKSRVSDFQKEVERQATEQTAPAAAPTTAVPATTPAPAPAAAPTEAPAQK
jgi:preprotein translocase subunit SecG